MYKRHERNFLSLVLCGEMELLVPKWGSDRMRERHGRHGISFDILMLFLLSQLHHNFLNLFLLPLLPLDSNPSHSNENNIQQGNFCKVDGRGALHEHFCNIHFSFLRQPDGIIFSKMIPTRAYSRHHLMKYWILLDWNCLRGNVSFHLKLSSECCRGNRYNIHR